MVLVHASCVDIAGTGILLRGAPGSGKSDLALRLIDGNARLVADDQVEITVRDGRAHAAPPEALTGRLEVRGIGIVSVPWVPRSVLGLVVDLVAPHDIERLPEPEQWEVEGVRLSCFALAPLEASAAAKVRIAVRMLRLQERWHHD